MSVTISGSGQIIKQVVQATYASTISTTSSTPSGTALTANITPTNASNKVLVLLNGGNKDYGGSVSSSTISIYLYRNGSQVAILDGMVFNGYGYACAGCFLDAPATTSATTYTIYISVSGGTGYMLNAGSTLSRPAVLTLMEVSGA